MFKSGEFVRQYVKNLDHSEVDNERVTPHGVELSIDKIYETKNYGKLSDGAYEKPNRTEAKITTRQETNSTERSKFYALDKGGYVIKYDNVIEIPRNHIGFVFPRSRVVRSNATVNTGIWDAGYKGEGEVVLQ
jgi:Deoxycytidine deaminase